MYTPGDAGHGFHGKNAKGLVKKAEQAELD